MDLIDVFNLLRFVLSIVFYVVLINTANLFIISKVAQLLKPLLDPLIDVWIRELHNLQCFHLVCQLVFDSEDLT